MSSSPSLEPAPGFAPPRPAARPNVGVPSQPSIEPPVARPNATPSAQREPASHTFLKSVYQRLTSTPSFASSPGMNSTSRSHETSTTMIPSSSARSTLPPPEPTAESNSCRPPTLPVPPSRKMAYAAPYLSNPPNHVYASVAPRLPPASQLTRPSLSKHSSGYYSRGGPPDGVPSYPTAPRSSTWTPLPSSRSSQQTAYTDITRPRGEADWFTRLPSSFGPNRSSSSFRSDPAGRIDGRPRSHTTSSGSPYDRPITSAPTAARRPLDPPVVRGAAPETTRPQLGSAPSQAARGPQGNPAPVARQLYHRQAPSTAIASRSQEPRRPSPPRGVPGQRLTRSRSISEPQPVAGPSEAAPRVGPGRRRSGEPIVVSTTLWEDELTIVMSIVVEGNLVARRVDNDWVNCTKLLNMAGMTRGKRDMFLKNEHERVVFRRGALHLKGVWLPLPAALRLAQAFDIEHRLYPLFEPNLKSWLLTVTNLERTTQLVQACRGRPLLQEGEHDADHPESLEHVDEHGTTRKRPDVHDARTLRKNKLVAFLDGLDRALGHVGSSSGQVREHVPVARTRLAGVDEGGSDDDLVSSREESPLVDLASFPTSGASAQSRPSARPDAASAMREQPPARPPPLAQPRPAMSPPPYLGRVAALAAPTDSSLAAYSLGSISQGSPSPPSAGRQASLAPIGLPKSRSSRRPSIQIDVSSGEVGGVSWFDNRTPPAVPAPDYLAARRLSLVGARRGLVDLIVDDDGDADDGPSQSRQSSVTAVNSDNDGSSTRANRARLDGPRRNGGDAGPKRSLNPSRTTTRSVSAPASIVYASNDHGRGNGELSGLSASESPNQHSSSTSAARPVPLASRTARRSSLDSVLDQRQVRPNRVVEGSVQPQLVSRSAGFRSLAIDQLDRSLARLLPRSRSDDELRPAKRRKADEEDR